MSRQGEGSLDARATQTSPSALLAISAIGLMAGVSPALAQDEPRLGGVTVTDSAIDETYVRTEIESPKATAPLLDSPQTVNVIAKEVIRDRAARTVAEVLRNTPGISFNAGENVFGTSSNNFSLRGFDTSGSVFVDNARDSGSYTRDVFNVESVEVIKGAAADNGRGTSGGYVNINTKRPSLDGFVSGDLSLGFDEYDTRLRKRGTIDINQPIGGTAAIRLNGVVEDSGVPGRDVARNKFWGIAPSIAFGLGTSFRALLSWEQVERAAGPDWGVPGATIAGTFRYDPAAAGARRDAFYGLASDFDDTTTDAVFGRLEYEPFAGFVVSNQTRWAKVKRTSRFTFPRGFTAPATVTATTGFYDRDNESLNNTTALNARFDTGGLSHSVAAGFEVSWERSNARRYGTVTPPATDLFNPDPNRSGAAPLTPTQSARADIETFAVYFYDTITIGEQFQLTGGVRGEGYKATLSDSNGGLADNFSTSPFTWGGKVGLTWKPAENISLYGSFGTSALPAGSYLSGSDISRTGDNAFPGFVPGARPVRSHNYEIGAKADFLDGALSTAIAAFRGEKRNVPVFTANALQGYQRLVVEGVELSVNGQITPEWNIFGGLLVMKSRREISDALEAALGAANPGDYSAAFPAADLDGDRLAFTPEVSATLWTTYRLPFGLTVGGGLQHVGSSFLGRPDDALRVVPNGIFGKLPAYTLFNAMLGYDLTENIDLRVNIDNIANKKYAVSTNWDGTRASLGAPRTFLVSTGFRF
jgi:catecholate siderophore receptor